MNINLNDYKVLYIKTAREHLQKIKIALDQQSLDEIRLHSHSLKNSSSVTGRKQIAQVASQIEQCCLAAQKGEETAMLSTPRQKAIAEALDALEKALEMIEKTNQEPDLTSISLKLGKYCNPN